VSIKNILILPHLNSAWKCKSITNIDNETKGINKTAYKMMNSCGKTYTIRREYSTVQKLSGTLSGSIRASLVEYIMPEMSASKYFEQESLPARDFFAKRKMIFIL
jgi:hypothetical protein